MSEPTPSERAWAIGVPGPPRPKVTITGYVHGMSYREIVDEVDLRCAEFFGGAPYTVDPLRLTAQRVVNGAGQVVFELHYSGDFTASSDA